MCIPRLRMGNKNQFSIKGFECEFTFWNSNEFGFDENFTVSAGYCIFGVADGILKFVYKNLY